MKKNVIKSVCLSVVVGSLLLHPTAVLASEITDDAMTENLVEAIDESEQTNTSAAGSWKQSGGKWWYLYSDNTYPVSQIVEIDGKKYAFDAQGWMVTGWYKSAGKWYYFSESGEMCTDWIEDQGVWYYLAPSDGVMLANTTEDIDGKVYKFESSGAMYTGWYKNAGKWYHFGESGAMSSGWVKSKGVWYYLNPSDGIMVSDKMELINEKTYLFDKSGAMLTGWQKQDTNWYYFEGSGAMVTGWLKLNSIWYYMDTETGIMYSDCMVDINDKVYAFKASGEMRVGAYAKKVELEDSDTTIIENYYFDKSGAMHTGWLELDNKWSYFKPDSGIRCEEGVYPIDGTYYAFDKNGIMVTGWFKQTRVVEDPLTGRSYTVTDKYYFNEQGMPQVGWLTVGSDKYWIDNTGWAVANGTYPVDKGRTAYFDADAKFVKFM